MDQNKQLLVPKKQNRWGSTLLLRVVIFFKRVSRLLPFWRHPHYTPFLLLCHPRSGSTWVHTALNSHPRILSLGEELRGFFKQERGEEKLISLFKSPQSKMVQAFGGKFFYEDAYSPAGIAFWNYWREKQRPVVHLKRRNLLRAVVSDEIARKNQQWSATVHQQAGSASKAVEIYPEIVMQRMGHIENLQEVFTSKLKNYPAVLSVFYEDLLENPEEGFYKIQSFLGVKPKPLFSLLGRQNPEPISQLLLNYEEVRTELQGGKWDQFLED